MDILQWSSGFLPGPVPGEVVITKQQYQSFQVWVVIVSEICLLHERTGFGNWDGFYL